MILLIPFVLLAQIERWVYVYDGFGSNEDIAYDLTCGSDGNIYAVGKSVNTGSSIDLIVTSLKDNGDTNWMYIYDYCGSEDMAMSVVQGLDNNIYVAGQSASETTYLDFLVLSLTMDGDTNWTYRYDGAVHYSDAAYSIAYGLDGNIYAAGKSAGGSGGSDVFVVSLSTAGDTNWTYMHSGSGVSDDVANKIVYGADGNIYVAGVCCGDTTAWDFFVMSLSGDGDTNWTYCYDGGLSYDAARSVVYGLDGNIYAAGYSRDADSSWLFTVISLTDEGNEDWVYTYDSDGDLMNAANDIIYGSDNNIYVAGECSWRITSTDFIVMSLSTEGDTNWTYRLNGSANYMDRANAIVSGSGGKLYAAGTICDIVSAKDLAVVSLNADGSENWIYTYTAAPSSFWDEAYAIDVGFNDNIYAAGYGILTSGYGLWDFTVVSLEPATGVEETKTDYTKLISLEAMPNPFSKLTNIRYSMLDTGYLIENMTLRIYDVGGRLVRSFHQESSIENQESVVSWDGTDAAGKQVPAGVYFVKLEVGDRSATEKILLVR